MRSKKEIPRHFIFKNKSKLLQETSRFRSKIPFHFMPRIGKLSLVPLTRHTQSLHAANPCFQPVLFQCFTSHSSHIQSLFARPSFHAPGIHGSLRHTSARKQTKHEGNLKFYGRIKYGFEKSPSRVDGK